MNEVSALPRRLVAIAREQAGVVSTRQCEEAGVGDRWRRHLVSSGRWSRLLRAVYDTGVVDPLRHPYDRERLRAVWTALLAYPRGAAVGAAALALHEVRGLPVTFVVEVALPGGTAARSRGGIRVRQIKVRDEVDRIGAVYAVRLPLALAQALETLDRDAWVACADNALNRGLISSDEFEAAARLTRGRRGIRERRCWFDMVDGRAESPLETRARLLCHDVGLEPDDLQREIFAADGMFLARADMAWYLGGGRWLLVEIDGMQFHSSDDQLSADATRQNGLLRGGQHILLRFRATHLRHPDRMTQDIRAVLSREGWSPGGPVPGADMSFPTVA